MPTITNILSEQGHSAKTIRPTIANRQIFLQKLEKTSDGRREAKVSEIEIRHNARLKPGRDLIILHFAMMTLLSYTNLRSVVCSGCRGGIKIEI